MFADPSLVRGSCTLLTPARLPWYGGRRRSEQLARKQSASLSEDAGEKSPERGRVTVGVDESVSADPERF